MQERHFQDLENRASQFAGTDALAQLEARSRVADEIKRLRDSGEALTLTDEESALIGAFRAFKGRLTAPAQFKFRTNPIRGVSIVQETNLIVHPSEEPLVTL